jgi:hypothetical protein
MLATVFVAAGLQAGRRIPELSRAVKVEAAACTAGSLRTGSKQLRVAVLSAHSHISWHTWTDARSTVRAAQLVAACAVGRVVLYRRCRQQRVVCLVGEPLHTRVAEQLAACGCNQVLVHKQRCTAASV